MLARVPHYPARSGCQFGLFFSDQSPIPVRIGAWLSSSKFALLSRSSTTTWTTDGKRLFGALFFLHGQDMMPQSPATGMVNSGQFVKILTRLAVAWMPQSATKFNECGTYFPH
jgi:hypothetical protein